MIPAVFAEFYKYLDFTCTYWFFWCRDYSWN